MGAMTVNGRLALNLSTKLAAVKASAKVVYPASWALLGIDGTDGLPLGDELGVLLGDWLMLGVLLGDSEGEVVLVFFALDFFAFGYFVVFRLRLYPIKARGSWALKAGMQSIQSTNETDLM